MIKNIVLIFDLFRKGQELSNVDKWKDVGTVAPILVAIIMGLVKLAGDFGYGVELTLEQATTIGFGIAAIVQFILHLVTSKRAGILPAKPEPVTTSDSDVAQSLPVQEAKPVPTVSTTVNRQDDPYFG